MPRGGLGGRMLLFSNREGGRVHLERVLADAIDAITKVATPPAWVPQLEAVLGLEVSTT